MALYYPAGGWVKLVVAEYDAAASIFLTHEQNVNFNLTPVLAAVPTLPYLRTPRPYLHRCCAGRAHEGRTVVWLIVPPPSLRCCTGSARLDRSISFPWDDFAWRCSEAHWPRTIACQFRLYVVFRFAAC